MACLERVDGDIWYLPSFLPGLVLEGRMMGKKCMDRLIGRHCKIVTKEPGDERAHVVFGMITLIDYDAGFIIIESDRGKGCLNMKTIEAIKPSSKRI
jgi:hypothetical protein